MINRFFLMTIPILIISSRLIAQVIDKDGNIYDIVKIGTQVWMAENLDVSHFRNGDSITEIEDTVEWLKAGDEGKPAWCYYKSNQEFGMRYHKLYNWYAVNDPRGLAPERWHIPSTLEWADLTDYLGRENIAGKKMKSANAWDGTNESGFTGLPGGYRNNSGEFVHNGNIGSWWSSSENDSTNAWSRSLAYGVSVVSRSFDGKRVGLSIRCIKD
jgi:uncharacterized protein (TIGR02145 family)